MQLFGCALHRINQTKITVKIKKYISFIEIKTAIGNNHDCQLIIHNVQGLKRYHESSGMI